jgi:alcohol dehydrogenase
MPAKCWRYHNPVEIIFGENYATSLRAHVADRSAVLITTPGSAKRGIVDSIRHQLESLLVGVLDIVHGYPTFDTIRDTHEKIAAYDFDIVIALGGGSAIDTAKLVAASETSDSADWLSKHLKDGQDFPEPFLPRPIIAVPTTAGTGSEVTQWATIWDFDEKKKYSMSHSSLYPMTAILDPSLTLTLSEQETLNGGLDALSHAMEAIWNKNHNPISDAFALDAIRTIIENLPLLKNDLQNIDLRTTLLCASLCAGMAFSNTKTALAHSISYPLTAHLDLPHGLACALPLPLLIDYNGTHDFERIKKLAEPLRTGPTLKAMQERMYSFITELGISSKLRDYGADDGKAALIAESAYSPERADNNIRPVSRDDLANIIQKLL